MNKYASEDIKERIKYYEDRENQAKQEGYDAGFLNGKEMVLQKAQEAIDRIIRSKAHGGFTEDELRKIFGVGDPYSIFIDYTLRDIIERFDKYDERNEIHVEDEVVFNNSEKAVVIKIFSVAQRVIIIMCSDGCAKCCTINSVKKTGNHFAEVGKLLEALRGGEAE